MDALHAEIAADSVLSASDSMTPHLILLAFLAQVSRRKLCQVSSTVITVRTKELNIQPTT